MKKELKDLLSADAKAQLTAEQQVRLKSLADSAEEGQEIDRLIAGSIEANRPKTVSDESLDKMRIDYNTRCSVAATFLVLLSPPLLFLL
eukprot:COSAG02_NODE_5078_length_4659_cov_3.744737_4_plen_89_part_00